MGFRVGSGVEDKLYRAGKTAGIACTVAAIYNHIAVSSDRQRTIRVIDYGVCYRSPGISIKAYVACRDHPGYRLEIA